MRNETITIAGAEYTISELPMRRNAQWRQQLQVELSPMADLMEKSQTVTIDANNAGDMMGIVRRAGELLIQSPDTITGLVFAYSPELRRDSERIMDHAYDSEIMDAFTAVLRLAFPFGRLLSTVRTLAANGATPTTGTTT